MTSRWRTVWITGASSGIGRELARLLAARGAAVAASARSAEALAELASQSPNIRPYPLDVTDRAQVGATIASIERELGPIDLAILNAGVWHVMDAENFDVEKIEQSMAVNYFGLVYALEGLIPAMRGRGRGHIAMVSSVAGYLGLPRAVAYGPSKSAAITLAESLKTDLERYGLETTIINPGFVDTPMTRVNDFPMPFIISAEEAAARIVKGLEQGRFEIAFPWRMRLLMGLARRLPYPIRFWFLRRMSRRPAAGS